MPPSLDTNIRVMGRVNPRPGDVCIQVDGKTIIPLEEGGSQYHHKFNFDHVFGTDAGQQSVFHEIGTPTVDKIMAGYNGTVFAYGQTGSGKTHTMLAPDGGSAKCLNSDDRGLIPRIVTELFDRLQQTVTAKKDLTYIVEASFYEIYNEELIDLLSTPGEPQERIRLEGAKETFRINGLTRNRLSSPADLLQLINTGASRRHIASTAMNDTSSRSHSIIQINVIQKDPIQQNITTSQLNLVDLAGCESLGRTGAKGKTAYEGTRINLSLTNLGIVITQLCKGEKYISFRDSLLTRVLQNSLGGNAITTMIVTMSQLRVNYSDTLSVLRFAERAKKIQNKARVNKQRTAAEWEMLFKQAEEEIEQLKQRLVISQQRSPIARNFNSELEELRGRLEMQLEEQQATANLLDEKEKEIFAAHQEVAAANKKAEKAETEVVELQLSKLENERMYATSASNLKELNERLVQENKAKENLQEKIKELEITLEGQNQELNRYDEMKQDWELVAIEKDAETKLATEESEELRTKLSERMAQLEKLNEEREYEKSMHRQEVEQLQVQIKSIAAQGGNIESALQDAMDQQKSQMDVLVLENKTFRDECHQLKNKVIEHNQQLAARTAELQQKEKQIDTLNAISEKSKAGHQDMVQQVKKYAEENVGLRKENFALQENVAAEKGRLGVMLTGVTSEKENALKEVEHLKEQIAQLKAQLAEKDEENEMFIARVMDLERTESRLLEDNDRLQKEAEAAEKELQKLRRDVEERDESLEFVQNTLATLAKMLVQNNSICNSEKSEMMGLLNAAMEQKNRDVIDRLASRLHDEKVQHELVEHVTVAMSESVEDLESLEHKLEDHLQTGAVLATNFNKNVTMLQNLAQKVTEILGRQSFADIADEDNRIENLEVARNIEQKCTEIFDKLQLEASQTDTDATRCPVCQCLYPKSIIRQHLSTAHGM